jgi:hypothetical protein
MNPQWQQFFAVAGFSLSLFLFAIKCCEFVLDRPRIKLKAELLRTYDPEVGNEEFPEVSFRIVNRGRRVAYILEIGVFLDPEPSPNPAELEELVSRLQLNIGEGFKLLESETKAFRQRIRPQNLDKLGSPGRAYALMSTGKTVIAEFQSFTKKEWDEDQAEMARLRLEQVNKSMGWEKGKPQGKD